MATYYNYLAVLGRIPGDDEDTVLMYEHTIPEDAKIQFAPDVFDVSISSPEQRERHRARCAGSGADGLGVFITRVLTSQSPIEEV